MGKTIITCIRKNYLIGLTVIGLLLAACNENESGGDIILNPPVDQVQTLLIGYCANTYNDALGKNNEEGEFSAAICLDTILIGKGNCIVAIRAGLSSAISGETKGKVFITKNLKGNPLYSQDFIAKGTGWEYIKLNQPYSYKERDTLYIGYTIQAKGYVIGFQETTKKNRKSDWIAINGQWQHLTSAGITGNVCLQAVVSGGNYSDKNPYDLQIGKPNYAGYLKENMENEISGIVTNYGTQTMGGCLVKYDDGEKSESLTLNEEMPNGKPVSFAFNLPVSESGNKKFTLTVIPIDNSIIDSNFDDNIFEGLQKIYDKSFERKLLLEQFTGQGCMYCPSGEESLRTTIGSYRTQVAWVAHHAGYGEDSFTIPASLSYTWFYNSTSTYAPAVMVNRTRIDSIKTAQPVISSFDLTTTDIENMLKIPTYVSMNLDVEYAKATREIYITVKGECIEELPNAKLTVFLIQDNIIGEQANGGNNYVHNAVIRDCLSSVWGDDFIVKNGSYEQHYRYILPEKIGDIPCLEKDIYIVAFIADYVSTNINACEVHNTAFKYLIND